MRALAFLALAGCNAILGIEEPTLQGIGPVDVTILKEFGQGVVASIPAGINCLRECTTQSKSFAAGQKLRLTATGAPGYAFAGWQDCPTVDGTACVVDRSATVTATFAPITANIIFVTSTTFNGSLGGVAGGDARCLAAAATGGLPDSTSYKALLSSSTEGARQHLGSARGFVRPDGLPVADTVDDLLVLHRMWYAADLTETGVVSPNGNAWTGSNFTGDGGTSDCGGWIKSDAGTAGDVGMVHASANFANTSSVGCDEMLPLICVQTSRVQQLDSPPPSSGKLVFLSTGKFTPSQGLSAANAICAGETPPQATGPVVALLATSSRSAKSLLAIDTYVRPDGIPIDAFGDSASAGWVHHDGSYAAPEPGLPLAVWNGSQVLGATPMADNHTCGDWSTTQGMGDASFPNAGEVWGTFKAACTRPLALYCIER
jgi:hypothetical protein